jgi:PadR family transcriptional regulator PadR
MAKVGNSNGSGENWEAQLRKGCLEMAILATLWAGPLYGLEILRSLDQRWELALAEGTLYPILARLKAEGLLQSEWVEADAGHPRKYYRLTAQGRRRTREMARSWSTFSSTISELVGPVLEEAR